MPETDHTYTAWRTSSYSQGNGACVEIAAWRRSSHSQGSGACIEVAQRKSSPSGRSGNDLDGFMVRDSKDPAGHALSFDTTDWRAFVDAARSGSFELASRHNELR